jgi:ankyrin repeat protein
MYPLPHMTCMYPSRQGRAGADSFGYRYRKMLLLQLLEASKAGKEEQVQELVLLGADVTGTNDAEATPLHLAAFHGHNSTVAMLLANRANVNAGDGLQAFLMCC